MEQIPYKKEKQLIQIAKISELKFKKPFHALAETIDLVIVKAHTILINRC